MDGTKRTALAAALYFLDVYGHKYHSPLPEDEVIQFCTSAANENVRRARGEPVVPITIGQIAAWLRKLSA